MDRSVLSSSRNPFKGSRLLVLLALGFFPWLSSESSLSRANGQVPGSPRIECDQPLVEWGELIKETPFTHEFEIRNTGDEVLIIKKVNGTIVTFLVR